MLWKIFSCYFIKITNTIIDFTTFRIVNYICIILGMCPRDRPISSNFSEEYIIARKR